MSDMTNIGEQIDSRTGGFAWSDGQGYMDTTGNTDAVGASIEIGDGTDAICITVTWADFQLIVDRMNLQLALARENEWI